MPSSSISASRRKTPTGWCTYSTDFQILRPVDRTKGNKRLLYEITNRGRTNVLETLNDSKTGNDVDDLRAMPATAS